METIRETICRKFKEALDGGGVKQIAVARRLGVAANTVQRWVNGDGVPSAENLKELSVMLGVPMEYFFDSSAPPSSAPQLDSKIDDLMAQLQAMKQPQSVALFDPELQALFDRAAAIPRERRKAMMEGMEECIEACENKLAREAQLTNIKKNA